MPQHYELTICDARTEPPPRTSGKRLVWIAGGRGMIAFYDAQNRTWSVLDQEGYICGDITEEVRFWTDIPPYNYLKL